LKRISRVRRDAVILIKPHFEVGREWWGGRNRERRSCPTGRGKKSPAKVEELGGQNIELMESPILEWKETGISLARGF